MSGQALRLRAEWQAIGCPLYHGRTWARLSQNQTHKTEHRRARGGCVKQTWWAPQPTSPHGHRLSNQNCSREGNNLGNKPLDPTNRSGITPLTQTDTDLGAEAQAKAK